MFPTHCVLRQSTVTLNALRAETVTSPTFNALRAETFNALRAGQRGIRSYIQRETGDSNALRAGKKRTADSNALRAGEDGDACVHPLWERSRVRCLCFFPNAAGMSCLRQTYVLEHFSTVPIFLKVSRGTRRCWFGRHRTPY